MSPHRSATVHSTVALVAGIAATDHHRGEPSGRRLLSLSLLALGIVYGDIGTSPLYALRECFYGSHPVPPTPANIFGVLSLIFWFRRRGTAGVGAVFGPIMLVWFGTLAVMGIRAIAWEPSVLFAINPVHAVRFFAANGMHGFLVLGAVFLVATGGEALYADLGHSGERAIQIDWFSLVGAPSTLQYFGKR